MDKAFITAILDFSNGTGAWGVTVRARLGALGRDVEATAFATDPVPPGGWKPLIKAAVINEAQQQLQTPVDTVIFPDLTIL